MATGESSGRSGDQQRNEITQKDSKEGIVDKIGEYRVRRA